MKLPSSKAKHVHDSFQRIAVAVVVVALNIIIAVVALTAFIVGRSEGDFGKLPLELRRLHHRQNFDSRGWGGF